VIWSRRDEARLVQVSSQSQFGLEIFGLVSTITISVSRLSISIIIMSVFLISSIVYAIKLKLFTKNYSLIIIVK